MVARSTIRSSTLAPPVWKTAPAVKMPLEAPATLMAGAFAAVLVQIGLAIALPRQSAPAPPAVASSRHMIGRPLAISRLSALKLASAGPAADSALQVTVPSLLSVPLR